MLTKYLIVAMLAAVPWGEEWLAIPIGIIIGLPPIPVMVVAFLGNIIPIIIIILLINRWKNRPQIINSAKGKRAAYYFEKYGLPGLSLLAPVFTGVYISTITSSIIGTSPRRIFFWMACSLAIWAVILVIISISLIRLFIMLT